MAAIFRRPRIRRGGIVRYPAMDHTTDKIHVMPDEGQWDVEDQEGALLTHDIDRDAAIARAKDLARERGVRTVVLHDGDGVTEEIAVEA